LAKIIKGIMFDSPSDLLGRKLLKPLIGRMVAEKQWGKLLQTRGVSMNQQNFTGWLACFFSWWWNEST